ncbi:hypothetical protein DFH09DRAFT_1079108 [Mycena vulgaris]|nr:hypothetical protein DFH09DRAFT_1079108 [Mycena vulgaris]
MGRGVPFLREAKTDTRPVTKKYNFTPNWKDYAGRGSNQNEYFKDLASNVKDLVAKAKFAHGGPTQNFQAPELGEAIANLLFHKPGSHRTSIGEEFPERFKVYSPNLVAAGATVLKNALDEHDTGHFRTIKLQSAEYRKFYKSVLHKIRTLQRHYPLKWRDTSATWAEWREKLYIEKNPDDGEVDDDLATMEYYGVDRLLWSTIEGAQATMEHYRGGAGYYGYSVAYLGFADVAPPNRRATFMSIVFSGVLLGVLLARVLSGIIAQLSSYRNIYWMGAAGEIRFPWLVLYYVL